MKVRLLILSLLFAFSLFSCGNKKRTADSTKLKHKNWKVLVDSLRNNNFEYSWIRSKANAKIKYEGKEYGVKTNIRVRRDSASWVNLSKGIQIMTAVASNDSIKVLKKINGKEFYIDDFRAVNKFLNTELDYSLLEEFFAGNAVAFDYDTKYKTGIEDGLYVLSTARVKKMDKLLKKGAKKHRDFLYRCWINPENYKCQKVEIDLLKDTTSIIVKYDDWKAVDEGGLFPFYSEVLMTTPKDTVVLKMKYTKVIANKPQTMPFKLTDSYKPMVFE